jgi:hypothetical protein
MHLLLLRGRQPHDGGAGEQRVEEHQTFHHAGCGQGSAVPAVGLPDGSVERFVMEVVDASAIVTTRVGRRVPAPDELREKLPRLLPVDDAGERRVLAQ